MEIQYLGSEVVRRCLGEGGGLGAVEAALLSISRGQASQPPRLHGSLKNVAGSLHVMVGATPASPGLIGGKILTLFRGNPAAGKPAIQGVVVLFDSADGRPVAVIDAASITTARTALASAVATRWLSREDSTSLALLGYGALAGPHLEAISRVRPIHSVRVWGPAIDRARAFADAWRRPGLDIEAAATAADAVADVDIICTLTASPTPILLGEWLRSGTHLNVVGAHTPTTREVDSRCIELSRVFVDCREVAECEAGDLLMTLADSPTARRDLFDELGGVIDGSVRGRASRDEITMFKSLGNAIEDLAISSHVLAVARSLGLGSTA